MKRLLKLISVILVMNEVLSPFSFALGDDANIFEVEENAVVTENETSESDSLIDDTEGDNLDETNTPKELQEENIQIEGEDIQDSSDENQNNENNNSNGEEVDTDDESPIDTQNDENNSSEQQTGSDLINDTEGGVGGGVDSSEDTQDENYQIEGEDTQNPSDDIQNDENISSNGEEVDTDDESPIDTQNDENNSSEQQTGSDLINDTEGGVGGGEISLEQGIENEGNQSQDGIFDTLPDSLSEVIDKTRYFFKSEGDDKYIKYGKDKNNIGIITLKDPKTSFSVTIMDKNLGANVAGIGNESYGYYFQWGNNHGVESVNSTNKTAQKAVYNDNYYSHGYDGNGVFIVGSSDYWENGEHYNSLWGNESKESSRYGACPVGYHIPTMKEWNQLLNIWGNIHTQDNSEGETTLRYSANYSARNIHTFKSAATQCTQGETECVDEDKISSIIAILSSELKLPLAGSYDENGNFHDGLGVYWTSISKNGNSAGVFNMGAYIGEREDNALFYKAQGHNIRCFQNVESYVAPTISEPQNDSTGIETDNSEESPLLPGEIQDEVHNNKEPQNTEESTQDSYPENDIPSDVESYPIIQDTTGDSVNKGINTKEYTITWKNEDGSIRDTTTVAYGQMPTHADPIQSADTHYSYEFAGWEPELKAVEGDAEYKAKYIYIPIEYTITWKNEDGTMVDTTKVAYGQIPTHKSPVQPADEKYSYKFIGWEPKPSEVKGNTEYRAKYEYIVNKFTITRENEDGTIIDTTEVPYGEIPTHEDPIQPADEKYSYEFAGWDSEITEVTGPAEYRATYKYITNKYTVTRKNEDGTILETQEVEYGTTPIYSGATPTKESTEEFEYTFEGWEPVIEEIKGDTVYTAKYIESPIIENEESNDGNETQTGSLEQNSHDNKQNIQDFVSESQNNEDIPSGTQGDENEGSFGGSSNTNEDITTNTSGGENSVQEGKKSEEDQGLFGGLWKTLKSFFLVDEDGYLRGSETIDNIFVSVEAEEGIFPIGTEVVIKGVSEDRLESIQTSLVEDKNNNVTENAQIVAFDISFLYSGEEIQPEKEVSVKFNYKENSDFQGSSMSELSVFHIDDETDEGEEVEVVNKEGDEIEILATSFSTYAVVAQKGLRGINGGGGIYNQMPDFEFTGIMINRPDSISNGPVFYIIMDRNLGATSTDTNSTDSYGYMYQWGNNYGFPSTGTSLPSNQVASKTGINVDLTEYGPVYDGYTQYYSGIFITAPGSLSNDKRYDWATTGNNNIWGDRTDKDEARQGPCPSGWHVPSMEEWSGAMAYWKAGSGNGSLNNFANYLHLPKAGSRARSTADLQKSGEGWFYTSTPTGKVAYALTFKTGAPSITAPNNRVDALSVRCFKDELICETGMHAELNGCVSNYKTGHCMTGDVQNGHYTGYMDEITIEWTGGVWNIPMCELVCDEGFHENDNMCIGGFVSVTFDLNGGRWYDGSIGNRDFPIEKGVDISDVRPKQDPYKNGYMFMGWFDENSNSAYRFKFQGTTLTGDLILTAHWAPFNDIVYTGIIGGEEKRVVLMDRNMGATMIGAGETYSTGSYGFYYQWGNNYGFYYDKGTHINTTTGGKYPNNSYGPNNWFYGESYYNISANDYMQPSNNNLWGGAGDNTGNNYDNGNKKYTRQGPCPKGYHVPSEGEWRKLILLFMNNNYPNHETTTVLNDSWTDKIGLKEKGDYSITSTIRDEIVNTFKFPTAGRVTKDYKWNRQAGEPSGNGGPRIPFLSSSPINNDTTIGFEIKFLDSKFNIGGWLDERGTAKPIRCFKDLDDYTVTWKNYDGTVLETDYYVYEGATPTYNGLEDPIKDELSEFTGWYLEGDEDLTIVDLSTESVDSDRVYVAKFIPIAPEDAYIVTVDINPLSGGNVDKESRYNSGDTVTLTGIANSGYEFLGWFTSNDIVSLDNPYVFIANDTAGTGFTAVFSPLYSIYTGTNNQSGGTISYEVSNITRQGKTIRFTATPTEDFELNKWILNGDDIATGGTAQLDIILSGDISLTGYFIQVRNLPCEFNGELYADGESVTGYQSDSVSCPNACVSQMATCISGVWNVVDFETEYSYSSCTYSGFSCVAEEYPLAACPTNGICSSCTGYSVVENACNEQSPIYKLEGCSDHYHINGNVCELDTYTVMIQSSNINSGTVTTGSITVPYGTNISKSGNILEIGNETSTANPNSQTWQYDFAFVDWTDTCGTTITTGCTVTANFQSILRTYTLDLIIGTGIETIYYKINGSDGFINTGITTTISGIEAGSTIYAYADPKDGYTYTETNESNPWSVTVTGDNIFAPEAVAGGVQYTVYHYVKIAGQSGYALSKTDYLTGTTDKILILSSLAKESEFMCAHYSSGSLTGTESGPGEIVTETTIKGDGTTVIYLYYNRNSRRVVLSGDEHIDYLEINGARKDEAIRECGGEVPINAKPKPGYHFVRWDKEEKMDGEENEETP